MFYFLHCTYSTELCLYVLCISFLNCFLLFILFGIVFLMGSFFGFPHDVVFLKTFYLTLHSFFHTLLDSRSFLFLQYCTLNSITHSTLFSSLLLALCSFPTLLLTLWPFSTVLYCTVLLTLLFFLHYY